MSVKGVEDEAGGGAPDDGLLLELVGGVVGPQRADGAAHHRHVHWDDRRWQVSHLQTHANPLSLSSPAATAFPASSSPPLQGLSFSSQPKVSIAWFQLRPDSSSTV